MRKIRLKKGHKIALYLFLGLLVLFLFWRGNDSPGLTPEMAMRILERQYLVEDTELLLCEEGEHGFVNAEYRNVLTMDSGHLYYSEIHSTRFLWWVNIGQWQGRYGLWTHPRSTPISHTLGNCQTLDTPENSFYFSIPLYILPEDETLVWDHVRAELCYDYRELADAEYKTASIYTAEAVRSSDRVTTLWFHEDIGYILGDSAYEDLADAASYLFDNIQRGGFRDNTGTTTLTVTLYHGDDPVHTETHDLAEWR